MLEEVTKIYDWTHMTPNYVKEWVPFYSVENVTWNNFFNNLKYISKDVFEKENKRVKLEKWDVLMTRIWDIWTPKLLDWDVEASFYVSLALIKKSNLFNSWFLNQYIKSYFFQKELFKKTIHVAFPKKINLWEIWKCKIFIPCLEEQQKIADFLSEIDEKINLKEKEIYNTKNYKKSLLQNMFV